jgi:predicted HD phosphohydrolase
MNSDIETIKQLFEHRGSNQYGGEAVNQLQHALQAAVQAKTSGQTQLGRRSAASRYGTFH